MMFFQFNPPMIALIELAENWITDKSKKDDLFVVLDAVRQINETELNQFLFSNQSMKKTSVLLNMFEDIKQYFADRSEAFDQLENAVNHNKTQDIENIIDKIEETTIIIQQAITVASMEDSKHRLSKYPVLNSLIQSALNVYGEQEPDIILEPRILIAINFVSYLQEQFDLYLEIRPQAAPWQSMFSEALEELKEGIGGIQVYLDEKNPKNLLAASHMIQESSQKLFTLLEDMYQKTESLFSFSNIAEIERLWIRRYRKKEGIIPQEKLDESLAEVNAVISAHEMMAQAFGDSLVNENIRSHYGESVTNAVQHERESFNKLTDDDTTLVALKDAVEHFIAINKTISEYVQQTIPNISEAANINEYRQVILGVYNGTTPVRILRRVTDYLKNELQKAVEIDTEAAPILAAQQEGIALVEEFLQTRERENLAKALEVIHSATVELIAYYKEKNEQAISSAESKPILCVKCGYQNKAGLTHCEYCYSYLLFAKNPINEAKSIIDYGSPAPASIQKPENLKKLEELASRIQSSSETVKVRQIVVPILNETKNVLEFFNTRPEESKEKDEIDPTEFIGASKLYAEGLESFLEYENNGDKNLVEEGMEKIRHAADIFMNMQTSVKQLQ